MYSLLEVMLADMVAEGRNRGVLIGSLKGEKRRLRRYRLRLPSSDVDGPRAKATRPSKQDAKDPVADDPQIDWTNLGFGLRPGQHIFVARCNAEGEWTHGSVDPYGPLQMSPAAQVFNYGQGVFEGLKAFRTYSNGVVLFRPLENAKRMARSAQRMCMQPPPQTLFLDGVERAVRSNLPYVPPDGIGSLYIRPLLLGSSEVLGLSPSIEYTFVVFVSPVSSYFSGGQFTPISLKVEEHYRRASPGGTGGNKVVGNYSPVLVSQREAKASGYADVLYLDASHGMYVEEVSSCNIFARVNDRTVVTPPVGETVLPGITRNSVIELSKRAGYTVEERKLALSELLSAQEVFTTGTAVQVMPVGSLTYRSESHSFHDTSLALRLYDELSGIQTCRYDDEFGWVHSVVPSHTLSNGNGTGGHL